MCRGSACAWFTDRELTHTHTLTHSRSHSPPISFVRPRPRPRRTIHTHSHPHSHSHSHSLDQARSSRLHRAISKSSARPGLQIMQCLTLSCTLFECVGCQLSVAGSLGARRRRVGRQASAALALAESRQWRYTSAPTLQLQLRTPTSRLEVHDPVQRSYCKRRCRCQCQCLTDPPPPSTATRLSTTCMRVYPASPASTWATVGAELRGWLVGGESRCCSSSWGSFDSMFCWRIGMFVMSYLVSSVREFRCEVKY